MILLDTHALVWHLLDNPQLGTSARQEIHRSWRKDEVCVSVISFWEIGTLTHKKRIQLEVDLRQLREELLRDGLIEIPVDGNVAIRANELTDFHKDPADRFIVATSLQGHRLVTADRQILSWPGELERIDARS